MAIDNLASIGAVCEGDLVYFRRLGKVEMESAKVIEIADTDPEPLYYLSNGMVVPKSRAEFFLHNVQGQPIGEADLAAPPCSLLRRFWNGFIADVPFVGWVMIVGLLVAAAWAWVTLL